MEIVNINVVMMMAKKVGSMILDFKFQKIHYKQDDAENSENVDKINRLVERLIGYMEKEVNENGYIPENFLFILPILKGNTVAMQLRSNWRNSGLINSKILIT